MYRFYSTPSGVKTVSAQITMSPGGLCGVDLQPPETGQAVLRIYDSNSSDITGKLAIAEIYCDAGMNGVNQEYLNPVCVNQGIYADLTGTTNYIVRYLVG